MCFQLCCSLDQDLSNNKTSWGSWSEHHTKTMCARNALQKTMTLFVFSYMVQWSPYMTYTVWSYFSLPPPELLIITVIILNMGGVYNSFAYTIMRKLYDSKDKRERQHEVKTVSTTVSGNSDYSFSMILMFGFICRGVQVYQSWSTGNQSRSTEF